MEANQLHSEGEYGATLFSLTRFNYRRVKRLWDGAEDSCAFVVHNGKGPGAVGYDVRTIFVSHSRKTWREAIRPMRAREYREYLAFHFPKG